MSLTTTIHDSLPYIDAEPTPQERSAALALITSELPSSLSTTTSHPSLPALPPQHFTPLIEAELLRISIGQNLTAIDTSRYESQDAPSSSPSSASSPESLQKYRDALARAYTSSTYLSGRQTNLALLEQFGKNAWLVGNSQLEDVLRGLERELAETKGEIDGVVIDRKNAQESVGAEVKGLEEAWRRGVGKVLETEVAVEQLRLEILGRRRQGAK
ncbi:Pre-mRNA-splicing factor SPF27 [Amylocarpus encephaloides]|uniref:Pre-mRNA-splicing factor SPF27 n=1 Tax=Amylocarpus encephaloides TaxID=45428 RepID=A0A9P7YQR1_9HELO|nr:Pre-mRNA-splicing factor SPF27 [Amylocarpus encephaloides]